MLNRLQNRRGFTLVELMVGILFISIAGISVGTMYAYGRNTIDEQRHRRVILERMQQELTRCQYIRLAYGTIPISENRVFTDTLNLRYPPEAEAEPTRINLEAEIEVIPSQALDPSGNPLYQSVSVTYTWVDISGQEYSVHILGNY